jgi:hypothetical protein
MHFIISILQLRGPSGSSVNVILGTTAGGYFMNIEVDVPAVYNVEGLCGTADGDNTNEMKIRGESTYKSLVNAVVPDDVATSWRFEFMIK